MSKRELKKYISELDKKQLEEQLIDLYERFKEVKEYYNFAFNPNENKLLEECKFKISKEYFPVTGKKIKARRSVAQKQIKHLIKLGVDCSVVADIMLYNIEIAQTYSSDKIINQEAFYISIYKSFDEAVKYIRENGLLKDSSERIENIISEAQSQNWLNKYAFEKTMTQK